MHGGFQIAVVDDIDLYFRSLLHSQRGAGDRAVVGEHSHFLLSDRFADRRDSQFVGVAVCERNGLAVACRGQAGCGRAERSPVLPGGRCCVPRLNPSSRGLGRLHLRLPRLTRVSGDHRSTRLDLVCDVARVILDEAEKCRPARVLPGETEEVEAGYVGDTPPVSDLSVGVEDWQLDPGVIGPVAGRPDDRVDLEFGAVGERDRSALGTGRARLQGDAVAVSQLAGTRSDQRLAALRAPAGARIDAYPEQTELRQPPEQVAAEQALRERRLPRADRKGDRVRGRELFRDLETGVSATDDENATVGYVLGGRR